MFLDIISYDAAAIAIAALPVLLVNWALYMRAVNRAAFPAARAAVPLPIKSILFFTGPIVVAGVAAILATSTARRDLIKFLSGAPASFEVLVNGQAAANSDDILRVIRAVSPYWAHHSHPMARIRIDISRPNGVLTVELARDSERPREYWVFIPGHRITSQKEVGRVTTSIFDSY